MYYIFIPRRSRHILISWMILSPSLLICCRFVEQKSRHFHFIDICMRGLTTLRSTAQLFIVENSRHVYISRLLSIACTWEWSFNLIILVDNVIMIMAGINTRKLWTLLWIFSMMRAKTCYFSIADASSETTPYPSPCTADEGKWNILNMYIAEIELREVRYKLFTTKVKLTSFSLFHTT